MARGYATQMHNVVQNVACEGRYGKHCSEILQIASYSIYNYTLDITDACKQSLYCDCQFEYLDIGYYPITNILAANKLDPE